jgi:hypothetical protein
MLLCCSHFFSFDYFGIIVGNLNALYVWEYVVVLKWEELRERR